MMIATACSSSTNSETPTSAVATESTATTTAPTTPTPECGDPVASFEPTGTLPRPGSMPAGSFMKEIQDRGRMIVGVSADTLLFGARNPLNGEIEGFDIDVLHQVAAALLGDPDAIEFKVITYADRIPSLQNETVDIVAHTMTINCARWQLISFSSEYYHAGQKVLVGRDNVAKEIEELDGQRVCAAEGSTNIDNLKAYPDVVAVGVVDLTDCLVLFQQGQVDGITGDDTVLEGFAAQDPYAKVIGRLFTDEPYGLGINQSHPEFVQFVNLVLERVRSDGTWFEIYRRWLGPVPNGTVPPRAVYGRRA